MDNVDEKKSAYGASMICAIVLVVIVYPMTVAPTGTLSNGGTLGLLVLTTALALSWRAFFCNNANTWLRLLVQLPLSAITSYLVIADAYKQYLSGHWLWF